VAPLPPGCELLTTYTAALTTRAASSSSARHLLEMLASLSR
jgi:hypothetical protein